MEGPGGARLTAASERGAETQPARVSGCGPAPWTHVYVDRPGCRLLPKATTIPSGAASARRAWRPSPRGSVSWRCDVALAPGRTVFRDRPGPESQPVSSWRDQVTSGGVHLTAARSKPLPAGRAFAPGPHGTVLCRTPDEQARHFAPREMCVPLLAGPRKEASNPGASAGLAVGS